MILLNTIRIGQTEHIEAEGEATTVVEGFVEAITFKVMTLGEVAFVEVEVKLDQIKSTIYMKSQNAG